MDFALIILCLFKLFEVDFGLSRSFQHLHRIVAIRTFPALD